MWQKVKSEVFDPLEVAYGMAFPYSHIETDEDDQLGHFNPLKHGAEEYDVSKYARMCHRVLPVFKDWNANHVRRLEQRTRRLVQHRERSAEDCLAAIEEESTKG